MKSQLYLSSGRRIQPFAPDPSQIDIQDIAHSLSMMSWGGGHFRRFYSIGEHSLNAAKEAELRGYSQRVQLACLLSESGKAYLGDLPPLVQKELPSFDQYLKQMQGAISTAFQLPPLSLREKAVVKKIQDTLHYHEFLHFHKVKLQQTEPEILISIAHQAPDPKQVKEDFLALYDQLSSLKKEAPLFVSVGIDYSNGKWMAALLTNNGYELKLYDTIKELCHSTAHADCLLIDIPIGLEDKHQQGGRPDGLLRRELLGKSSSVFSVPAREAVYAETSHLAKEYNQELLGRSLSVQTIQIIPAIREVDSFLQGNPEWKNRLTESHPEYAFALLNSGIPVGEKKQRVEGREIRLELLRSHLPVALEEGVLDPYPYKRKDDVVDALALATLGMYGLEYGFTTLPEKPQTDSTGLKMQVIGAVLPKTKGEKQ